MNYVCYCTTADGAECVLKVGVPHFDLTTEIEALEHYDGRGIVRVLRTDPERHALLLEKVRPARMLQDLRDNREESRIAARVIRGIVRPAPEEHNLPNMVEKIEGKLARARHQLEDCHILHDGERFDLIVDSYCLNHIMFANERCAVLDSVKARLEPDGYFLLSTSVYYRPRHQPETKIIDAATGIVYDSYDDDCLYDPETDYYYEPLACSSVYAGTPRRSTIFRT